MTWSSDGCWCLDCKVVVGLQVNGYCAFLASLVASLLGAVISYRSAYYAFQMPICPEAGW